MAGQPKLRITLPGLPAASHFFCFAKKVTKKGKPTAPLFVFFVADISVTNRAARKLALTFN
jgi:hypothetical protein